MFDYKEYRKNAQEFRVYISKYDGVWTAICDGLGLVTEADSYEGVIERAREIAPQLYELNGFTPNQKLNLDFIQVQVNQQEVQKVQRGM